MRLAPDVVIVAYRRSQLDHAEGLMGTQGLILRRLDDVDGWPRGGPALFGFVRSPLVLSHVVWDRHAVQALCDVQGVTSRGLSWALNLSQSAIDAWLRDESHPAKLAQARLMGLLERLAPEDMSRFYAKLVAAHVPAGP